MIAPSRPVLRSMWLLPPLAYARSGNSTTPLDAFGWGPNDDTPHGTGKTTLRARSTLRFADDGSLHAETPTTLRFKDESGLRPVCPFFELHGEWEGPHGVVQGIVTPEIVDPARLRWRVEVANLKAYNFTLDPQTRIEARAELRGDDLRPITLEGRSPPGSAVPLVPPDRFIPLGTVRLARSSGEVPGFRLRFVPGPGSFFAPSNVGPPWDTLLPAASRFLNPAASWCAWKPGSDKRTVPEGKYARAGDTEVSLGLVDDICDGIVSCTVEGIDLPPACARVVVGPPDYAPDRRHPVSAADGLKDRVDRTQVSDPHYLDDMELAGAEIRDLLERVLECVGMMNLDAFNEMFEDRNRNIAFVRGLPYKPSDHYAFIPPERTTANPFPLTEAGREHHRRYVALEVFADFVRKRPRLIEEWIREPVTPNAFFNRKMPALMIGPSGDPLHLTRRQYDLLVAWAAKLRSLAADEP